MEMSGSDCDGRKLIIANFLNALQYPSSDLT